MSTTTSDTYVWTWLPDASEPVVAGRLEPRGPLQTFVYARSYRERPGAIPLYLPELPLRAGRLEPAAGLTAPGCILDARPDAWGQRVILNRLTGGQNWRDTDPGVLDLHTYLLESGSDRFGALDFQTSSTAHVARGGATATLEELLISAERVEQGVPLTPTLDAALLHGSSIGGARPKALLRDDGRHFIAKFPSSDDRYSVPRSEYVAMTLARRVGLDVAPVRLVTALDRPVLLVERFDRSPGMTTRRHTVSALTILGLDELQARWASYADLAQVMRARFIRPRHTQHELFARLVFNVLMGNTDDHARNHAAFWDGSQLSLTPAYDICPQLRSGGEASQGMAIGRDGYRLSSLAGCIARAAEFALTESEARAITDHQRAVVERDFEAVCDEARLSAVDQQLLRRGSVLHPFALGG